MSKQLRQTWSDYLMTAKTNAPLFLRLPAQHIAKAFGTVPPSEVLRRLTPMSLPRDAKERIKDELGMLMEDWKGGKGGNYENLSYMHENGVDGWVSLGSGGWEHLATAVQL